MKNSNFRNSFISTLTVTVVGVLLFGVNAALSETPVASPPGGGVGPTFTGLNLTGSVRNETSVDDPVTVDDDLNLTGGLRNGTSSDSNPVIVEDYLNVNGELSVGNGGMKISGPIGSPKGTASDDYITFNNGIDVYGNSSRFHPTGTDPYDLEIGGNINFDTSYKGGAITGVESIAPKSGSSISINGNAKMTGYLTLGSDQFLTSDKISSSDPLNKPIRFNSPIGVMSDIVSDSIYLSVLSSIKAKGWLITETNVNVQGSILNTKEGTESTWIPAKNAYINTTVGLPVTVDDSLEVTGDLSLNGEVTSDLSVTGKLTADGGIGTFYTAISSSPVLVTTKSSQSSDQACPSGKIVSCHIKPVGFLSTLKNTSSWVAYPNDNLTMCTGKMYNGTTGDQKFNVIAVCFDSAL